MRLQVLTLVLGGSLLGGCKSTGAHNTSDAKGVDDQALSCGLEFLMSCPPGQVDGCKTGQTVVHQCVVPAGAPGPAPESALAQKIRQSGNPFVDQGKARNLIVDFMRTRNLKTNAFLAQVFGPDQGLNYYNTCVPPGAIATEIFKLMQCMEQRGDIDGIVAMLTAAGG